MNPAADEFRIKEGVGVITPDLGPAALTLTALVSTRIGGVSREPYGLNLSYRVGDRETDVQANRDRFFAVGSIPSVKLCIPGQVHGQTVRLVDSPGFYPECDGLVTDSPGLFLSISVADCLPIFLHDPEHEVIALVHAGWRGSVGKIVQKCLELMTSRYTTAPNSVVAYIGPGAGVCCYEVGNEVADSFPTGFLSDGESGMPRLDLKRYNKQLLLDFGLPPEGIRISAHCTICESDKFHSYRRDKANSGRMMAIFGKQAIEGNFTSKT